MVGKGWVVWLSVLLLALGDGGYAATARQHTKPAVKRVVKSGQTRALKRPPTLARAAKVSKARRLPAAKLKRWNVARKQRWNVRKDGRWARHNHTPQDRREPFVYASSVLVVDSQSGRPIYAKNPDQLTPIASITKLMTALVTLEANLPLGEYITITSEDVDRIKHTRSRLALGTTLTRLELLHLALIASENRAAAALSRAYPGGRRAFVAAMNRKARELGMTHTYFVDGTGLSSQNRSTAQDLVKLVQAAYRNPLIRQITTTASYEVEKGLAVFNTNRLVHRPDWQIGVSKTGFINEAGYCLVMQTNIAGRPVIMVLLHSRDKWSRIADAERIRKWLEGGAMQRYVERYGKDVPA